MTNTNTTAATNLSPKARGLLAHAAGTGLAFCFRTEFPKGVAWSFVSELRRAGFCRSSHNLTTGAVVLQWTPKGREAAHLLAS